MLGRAKRCRISQIKAPIEETTSDYDTEKRQERLAKMAGGGVALLRAKKAVDALHSANGVTQIGDFGINAQTEVYVDMKPATASIGVFFSSRPSAFSDIHRANGWSSAGRPS